MAHSTIRSQVQQDILSGATLSAIAAQYGISVRTVQRWAKAEKWPVQHKQREPKPKSSVAIPSRVAQVHASVEQISGQVQEIRQHADQLIDVLEMTSRHLRFSRALQSIVGKALQKLDPNDLSPRDLLAFLDLGIKIETLLAGQVTERLEVRNVDVTQLSDEQLQQIADGKDPRKVLEASWQAS